MLLDEFKYLSKKALFFQQETSDAAYERTKIRTRLEELRCELKAEGLSPPIGVLQARPTALSIALLAVPLLSLVGLGVYKD